MKPEMRYIAFDGMEFIYKEDAEHHEIMCRLRAKYDALRSNVSDLMREKTSTSRRITNIERALKTINDTFVFHPEVMATPDNIRLMVRRMNLRLELKRLKDLLKSIKPLLIEQNRKFSKAELDLKRYKDEHDNLIESRKIQQNNQ